MINPFSKPHPSSVLAKSVKTQKDVERCRLSMAEPRPSLSKRYESFERAKSQFIARYSPKPSDIYTVSKYREPKSPVRSEPERSRATHRISPKQAQLFREFQYNASLLSKDSPLSKIACVVSTPPVVPEEEVHLSSVTPARKPTIVRIPSYTIPEASSAEIVEETEVNSDVSSKRESFQSDVSDSSACSDVTLVERTVEEHNILKKYKDRKDYADESTWRTASVIMRAHARKQPLPSRNDDWAVLPEARRPKGALRRSSAQRTPRYLKRTASMKRQTSSHANN